MKKKIYNVSRETFVCVFLVTIVFSMLFSPIKLSASTTLTYVDADEAMLTDVKSGSIMYQQNIDEQHGIASLTKLMSLYVAFDEMEEQGVKLSDKVTISDRAAQLKSQSTSISGVYFNAGSQYTYKKLIELSVVYSDNTAIIAISEALSGSEKAHVKKMNEKAQELGMTQTKFYNVTGLTMSDYGDIAIKGSSPDQYNVSSARDMTILAMNLLEDYPQITDYTKMQTVDFEGQELPSYNLMLPNGTHAYDGVIGLKTGTSNIAGDCFMGLYKANNGRYYVSVVLGASDADSRFTATAEMYDWLDSIKQQKIVSNEQNVEINLDGDRSLQKISLHPKNSAFITSESTISATLSDVELNNDYFDEDGQLEKEIPPGQTIVTLTYKTLGDDEDVPQSVYDQYNPTQYNSEGEAKKFSEEYDKNGITNGSYYTVELVSDDTINVEGPLKKIISSISDYFVGIYESI